MKKAKYFRNGNKINTIATGEVVTYDSITKAKRASRELQMAEDGALGRGSLFVSK